MGCRGQSSPEAIRAANCANTRQKIRGEIMKKLTPKQKKFCIEYMIDLNGEQAAIRAGYSKISAQSTSSEILSYPNVKQAIKKLQKKQEKRTLIKADDVILELKKPAFSDIRKIYDNTGCLKNIKDLPNNVAGMIASVESDELCEGTGKDRKYIGQTKKVKLWDKLKALELLGKHLGLFTDKVEVTGKGGGPVEINDIKAKLLQKIAVISKQN